MVILIARQIRIRIRRMQILAGSVTSLPLSQWQNIHTILNKLR